MADKIPLFTADSGQVRRFQSGDTISATIAPGSGGTPPNIQIFVADGTWTKPSGTPVTVNRYAIGAGGGGASGRSGNNGTIRGGGGGGGGGGYSLDSQAASLFNATETVTVGVGGPGGAATTGSTDGNAGTAGENTTMTGGAGAGTITANGGAGGAGGTNAAGGAGGAGGTGTGTGNQTGGAGGNGTVNATAGTDGGEVTGVRNAGGGGGGGAGLSAGNLISGFGGWGGASGGLRTRRNVSLAATAAAGAQPLLPPAFGNDGQCLMGSTGPLNFGGSGGGGAAGVQAFATAFVGAAFGGFGGKFGGGGGGGAGIPNALAESNDGFAGADGIVIVITTF